jgi:hypothetical protein
MRSILFFLILALVSAQPAVRLTNVEALTFNRNAMTTGRRSAPVQQMTCLGSYCNYDNMPTTMQCYNKGHNGLDVVWKCEAQLKPGFKLGTTNVNCEGYNYPDDPFILAGSCGVEYELLQDITYQIPTQTIIQVPTQTVTTTYTTETQYQNNGGSLVFTWLIIMCFLYLFIR